MSLRGKLCDAGDWFGRELPFLIQSELRELPRLHRKQWEFGMILRALHAEALLHRGSRGLSMGGGRERLLYAVADHVDRLMVTDLYGGGSDWEEARTDEPMDFIEAHMPFPVEAARIEARRMDMRQLDFAPASFDFCYSSCAIEHIGGRDDFLAHLREAHRVLKEGGTYVLTTEFHYGPETIELPGNYIFSGAYLSELFADSPFAVAPEFDAALARHRANVPLPANLPSFRLATDAVAGPLLEDLPHLQLLRGPCPFTSALFVLKKARRERPPVGIRFGGLSESREFLAQGVEERRVLLANHPIALMPFAGVPGGRSAFLAQEAPAQVTRPAPADDTVFHTDYVWLGAGARTFRVTLAAAPGAAEPAALELRVHRVRAQGPFDAECVASVDALIAPGERITRQLPVLLRDDCCYAVLGKVRAGSCLLEAVEVESPPAR
jgi:SAM-dependent methyltransferase